MLGMHAELGFLAVPLLVADVESDGASIGVGRDDDLSG